MVVEPRTEQPQGSRSAMARLQVGAGILAFLRGSGRAARPLVGAAPTEHGMTFWRFVFGTGLVLPWLLQTLSMLRHRHGRRAGTDFIISELIIVSGSSL